MSKAKKKTASKKGPERAAKETRESALERLLHVALARLDTFGDEGDDSILTREQMQEAGLHPRGSIANVPTKPSKRIGADLL